MIAEPPGHLARPAFPVYDTAKNTWSERDLKALPGGRRSITNRFANIGPSSAYVSIDRVTLAEMSRSIGHPFPEGHSVFDAFALTDDGSEMACILIAPQSNAATEMRRHVVPGPGYW